MKDAPNRDVETSPEDVAEQLARKYLGIDTLTTRNRDSLDFHDLAVWKIKAVLARAYDAGRASAQAEESP